MTQPLRMSFQSASTATATEPKYPRPFSLRLSEDEQEHAAQLAGLGQSRLASNINQIAKAANMGALPVTPDLIDELYQACAAP